MTGDRPLHGVLYGHGHMGRLHAAKLTQRADIRLDVVDPPAGFETPPNPSPDFAIIATPTPTHRDVALPLLDHGIPCLVEKPLSDIPAHAQQLARFPHLSVGHVERFNPALGPLWGADARFIECERIASATDRGIRIDVIADLMIHDIDLVLRLMPGEVRDVRALGVGVVSGTTDIANARIEIVDPQGISRVAVLTASRVSPRAVRSLRLIEPGVYWSVDLLARSLHRVPWGAGHLDPEVVAIPVIDPLTAEHDAFLGAVRGNGPFPCPGGEAIAALELAARIRGCIERAPH